MDQQLRRLFEAPILDARMAAQFFGHESRYKIDKWRARDQGPDYFAIGDGPKARIRYSISDLMRYAVHDNDCKTGI